MAAGAGAAGAAVAAGAVAAAGVAAGAEAGWAPWAGAGSCPNYGVGWPWKMRRNLVRPERFELPAFWFVARRSIQLS